MARNYIEERLCTPKEAVFLSGKQPIAELINDIYQAYYDSERPSGREDGIWNIACLMAAAYTFGMVQAKRECRKQSRIQKEEECENA